MDTVKIIQMLSRPSWTANEIHEYFELIGSKLSLSYAHKIKNAVAKAGKTAKYRAGAVTVDGVMLHLGKNRITEIELYSKVLAAQNNGNKDQAYEETSK